MVDIESLGLALACKVCANDSLPSGLDARESDIAIRSEIRALTGMQKEALIYNGVTGTGWRMVCDEGPYLNGTDLAPFPLAFYTTGMAISFTDQLLKHAHEAGVIIKDYRLTQDNFYTMEGSAIRGDMIGGALPVKLCIELVTDSSQEIIQKVIAKAEKTSPAQVYMNQVLNNTFSLNHNGRETPTSGVSRSVSQQPDEPTPHLASIRPLPEDTYCADIITKLESTDAVFGVEGGAGSSLKATQKRTLHVRGLCILRDDGLREVTVQLFKPLGSTFRFLGDSLLEGRAPSGLEYLAAGVGFCFMTQIGRYATIMKHDLHGYSIVQDTIFHIAPDSAGAEPVDTHTFIQTDLDEEAAQKTLFMSERTCFLHAAMRGSNASEIQIRLNGSELETL
ncbi:MAG: OsmC family protein [Candidatus Promineifilaceae bacterium]|nr:OsmC family protein [Candidatus Promineifilaceae bacterium]